MLARPSETCITLFMNNTTTTLKLGDKVSANYHGDTVVGIISGFSGRHIMLDFQEPQKLWNRVESDGVMIHPDDRATIKLIQAGQDLSDADMVEVSGHGMALRR